MADRGDAANTGPHRLSERQHAAIRSAARSTTHVLPPPDDAEKTIVVRDRRKPNQYTTDNVIAREWLPILRVGDAFFFYSVYLSMANRETESSWGSLRTQAEYLQCSVDLIVRGNKLLEICELVHIETGNQYTSNEYYILDPPPLTAELQARIRQRLDDIARQETSQNWQSWVKQVGKAISRHRALTDIWAERRARRGGRPVKAVRPDEAENLEKGVCESQADDPDAGENGKGGCESQPPWLWDTTAHVVSHNQGRRDPQPEQDILTRTSEQGKERKEDSFLLAQDWLTQLGVAQTTIDFLKERYPMQRILQQLEWLRYRNPRDPAAMLVSAVQGNWDPPLSLADSDLPGSNGCGVASVERAMPEEQEGERSVMADPPDSLHLVGAGSDEDGFALDGTEMDARDAWSQLLAEVRLQMTRVTFDTWLGGTEVAGVHGNVVSVLVRDGYAAEWLQARWKQPIERTMSGIVGCPVSVRFLGPSVRE